MITVKDLLKTKGHSVYSTSPDATVYEALKLMADKGIGALVVLEDEKLVGIISERDYARKVILKGVDCNQEPIRVYGFVDDPDRKVFQMLYQPGRDRRNLHDIDDG